MNVEDLKFGMKVVPFQKTVGISWKYFTTTQNYKNLKDKGYLLARSHTKFGETYLGDDSISHMFKNDDFVPYVEEKNNKNNNNTIKKDKNKTKNQVLFMESLPYKANCKIESYKNVEIQTYGSIPFKVKIIVNGTTTIMIDLDTKEKVISKLHPEDTFDLDKGISICHCKLMLKKYTNILNELIK